MRRENIDGWNDGTMTVTATSAFTVFVCASKSVSAAVQRCVRTIVWMCAGTRIRSMVACMCIGHKNLIRVEKNLMWIHWCCSWLFVAVHSFAEGVVRVTAVAAPRWKRSVPYLLSHCRMENFDLIWLVWCVGCGQCHLPAIQDKEIQERKKKKFRFRFFDFLFSFIFLLISHCWAALFSMFHRVVPVYDAIFLFRLRVGRAFVEFETLFGTAAVGRVANLATKPFL